MEVEEEEGGGVDKEMVSTWMIATRTRAAMQATTTYSFTLGVSATLRSRPSSGPPSVTARQGWSRSNTALWQRQV